MKRIVIVVMGGNVCDVYADEKAQVDLIDFDNEATDAELKASIKGLQQVY